jgi:LDH2 family malate/lactate/ureidoglycolate dehydrogenase
MPDDSPFRIQAPDLERFCTEVFIALGIQGNDAEITSKVLVAADLRGVDSHGVARLKRYVDGIHVGMMRPNAKPRVVHETAATATIDADGGLGQPPSYRAMQLAMEKAEQVGAGFVAVRNSNHYGIAGYYAMMALEKDMIGISTTNADVLVVPTFGRDAMFGTNPIAVAAPALKERPFVLDMATSVVPRGKLEVYDRLGKPLPDGWASEETGRGTNDAARVLRNFATRAGGGLLPLGGEGELHSGYKGYGLALLVDILSAVLPGAAYANLVYPKTPDGKPLPSNIGHFFGALRIDGFRPIGEFKADMDELITRIKKAPKAEGAERIYIHGEKEFEKQVEREAHGIPLHSKVLDTLKGIGAALKVPFPG